MEVKILKQEKDELEVKLDNQTVAEILRVYLNNNGIEFAACWRAHPTKPVIMKIVAKGKTVKKEVSEAVSAIKKDLDKIASLAKK